MIPQAFTSLAILSAIDKAKLLRDKIDGMFALQYTSKSAIKLLHIFHNINTAYLHKLEELRHRYFGSPLEKQKEGILTQIRTLTGGIIEMHSYLRFIEAARVGKAQSGIVLSMELLSKKLKLLDKPHLLSIVRPQWKYNYKCLDIMSALEPLLFDDDLLDASGTPKIFGIMSFAGLEYTDALAQVMLAHEIGHLIDQAYDISETYPSGERIVGLCKIPQERLDEIVNLRLPPEFEQFPTLWNETIKKFIDTTERNDIQAWIVRWIREFTADIIALRIVGPVYFFSLTRFATPLISFDDIVSNYPPMKTRLEKIITEMENKNSDINYIDFFKDYKAHDQFSPVAKSVLRAFDDYKNMIIRPSSSTSESQSTNQLERQLELLRTETVNLAISDHMKNITIKIRKEINKENGSLYVPHEHIFNVVNYLQQNIPPTQIIDFSARKINPLEWSDVLNAGCLVRLHYEQEALSNASEHPGRGEGSFDVLDKKNNILSKLILFGIEFAEIYTKYYKKTMSASKEEKTTINSDYGSKDKTASGRPTGVLSKTTLWEKISKPSLKHAIVVSPLCDFEQIKKASLDVRLGNKFIVTRQGKVGILDPGVEEIKLKQQIRQSQEMTYVLYGDKFILHPKEFVLGSTLEYFSLPSDTMAYVIGRSSWGRLGLVIATATKVTPGFKGVLTLELANVGLVPIALYPGVRIAQLIFHSIDKPIDVDEDLGKYQFSTVPKFSEIYRDRELRFGYIFP